MATIEFGYMLQSTARVFHPSELLEHNLRLIRALSAGFTTLWSEDHLQWGEMAALECLTTLSFLAGTFPQFRLGMLVLSQAYRNPALLAKMIANLQFLTGGRVILGLGAGWKEDEYHAYGYPFPNAAVRLDQLEEAIGIIRSMWTKRPSTFTGTYYRVQDAYCEPQPSPAIPLLIGGGGERQTLALVARYADWWNFNSSTVEEYSRKLAALKAHCEGIGRDPAAIKLTYLGTVLMSEYAANLPRTPHKHHIEGSAANVIREIERFCEIGVTHFMLRVPDLETAERFVATVVPHFV